MGYRVEYGSVRKVRGAEKRVARIASLTALFFVAFLLLVTCFWPQGRVQMQEALCPEEMTAAAAALENLAVNLENGVSLEDSLAVFSQEVGGYIDTD